MMLNVGLMKLQKLELRNNSVLLPSNYGCYNHIAAESNATTV